MGNDYQIVQWAERHLAGELNREEQRALNEKLANDPVFAASFQDALAMIRSLEGAGRDKRFRDLLGEISAAVAEEQEAPEQQPSPRTIPLRTHYFRTAAVAAGVALLTSVGAGWLVSHRNRSDNSRYVQLAHEVEAVKRSQKNILDSIKENNRSLSPAAPVNRSGTGFALSNNGYLVTNYHVVSDADSLYIRTRNGNYYKASLKAFNQQADIAILQVTDRGFRFGKGELPYSFAAGKTGLGARAFSLGYPQDEIVYNEGYISSRNGFEGDSMQYRLEMPAEPGQSGAPVLDAEGSVIGILTAKETQTPGTAYAVSTRQLISLVRSLPRNMNVQLPKSNKLGQLNREQQLDKLQDYTCMVLVYKK